MRVVCPCCIPDRMNPRKANSSQMAGTTASRSSAIPRVGAFSFSIVSNAAWTVFDSGKSASTTGRSSLTSGLSASTSPTASDQVARPRPVQPEGPPGCRRQQQGHRDGDDQDERLPGDDALPRGGQPLPGQVQRQEPRRAQHQREAEQRLRRSARARGRGPGAGASSAGRTARPRGRGRPRSGTARPPTAGPRRHR